MSACPRYIIHRKLVDTTHVREWRKRVLVLSISQSIFNVLATSNRNMYSPRLKERKMFASIFCLCGLYFCLGTELNQFIVGTRKLTPDRARMLNSVDKLEKNLFH